MINFVKTTTDVLLLQSWIDADPSHSVKEAADWWVFGGYLHFKLVDEQGTTMFVRFDREGDLLRLHTQFAPVEEVSETRVAKAISQAIPEFSSYAKLDNVAGIITESSSPKLIAFLCGRLGFKSHGNDNYVLVFDQESV